MARGPTLAGADLSPLPLAGDPPAASRGTRRRSRWPVVALAGVMAAVAVAFPGRLTFERSLVSSWAGPWAAAEGLDAARLIAMAQLNEAAGPDDAGIVNVAVAGLYDEEAVGLDRLAARLRAGGPLDPSMRALGGQLRAAMRAQAADLRGVAVARAVSSTGGRIPPDRSKRTAAAVDSAGARLRGQLRRFQLTSPRPPLAQLHAADAALARLGRWLDQPAGGATLLASTDGGMLRLEIDASRVVDAGWPEDAGSLLVGQPHLIAYASGGVIMVGPADTRGRPGPVANGDAVIAAGRPDAFWILSNVAVANPTLSEVDGHGRILVPPVLFPDDRSGLYSMAVPAGLVRTTRAGFGLQVWDPVTGRVRTISNQDGEAVAVWGQSLAWIDSSPSGTRLHMTDTSTGGDRVLLGAGGPVPGHIQQISQLRDAQGEFSPDGRWLAYYSDVPDPSGLGNSTTKLTVLDVTTGAVAVPAAPISHQGPGLIAWTPDSQRLFFGINTTSGRPELATYRVGDASAHTLRFRSPTAGIRAIVALAP